jgi:hypothetical protein
MKAKDILEAVFKVSFPNGEYMGRVLQLDAQSNVGKAQILTILIKVCEALDKVDADLQRLKNEKEKK